MSEVAVTTYRQHTPTIEAMQLTSTNVAAITAWCPAATIQADGTVRLSVLGQTYPVPVNAYIVQDPIAGFGIIDQTAFETAYFLPSTSPTVTTAVGTGTLPASIAAGATSDITITLSATMPNSTYTAMPTLMSSTPALLGGVAIQGVIARTPTTVTVRVKNTGLAALLGAGVTVGVIAISST
jgi:hypothetical protein